MVNVSTACCGRWFEDKTQLQRAQADVCLPTLPGPAPPADQHQHQHQQTGPTNLWHHQLKENRFQVGAVLKVESQWIVGFPEYQQRLPLLLATSSETAAHLSCAE
jgi:hypothetical protein